MPSAVEECCETLGKCQGIVREFHIVWRVVTLRIILHVLVQMGSLLQLFYFCLWQPVSTSSRAARTVYPSISLYRSLLRYSITHVSLHDGIVITAAKRPTNK